MKKNSITNNYLYNLTYQIIISIVPLITTPYLTRILGAKNLGIYSYTYSIVTIFFLLSSLGLNTYGQREIAYVQDNKNKRTKIFWELTIFRIFSTLLSITLFLILINLETTYKPYLAIFTVYIIANLFDISWFYQGIENFKTITIRNTIIRLIYVLSIFIFIKTKNDLKNYIFLYSSMILITNLSFWINLKKLISKPQKLNLQQHIKPAIIFFIPQIASLIYTVLDKTMLGIMNPDIREVSFYEQSAYIVKTVLMLITTISTIMVSKISYAYNQNNQNQITNYLKKIINFIWLLGTPITFGICATIKNFIPWFYGPEYLSVINLVYTMSPIIIIISLNNLIGVQFLVSTKNQNKYIFAVLIGAIINFILNLVLINYLGAIGATIASVTAELIILLIELYFFKKIISNINIMKNSLKYIFFGLIMFIISYLSGNIFNATIHGTIFQVLTGITTYGILLLISKDQFVFEQLNKLKISLKK